MNPPMHLLSRYKSLVLSGVVEEYVATFLDDWDFIDVRLHGIGYCIHGLHVEVSGNSDNTIQIAKLLPSMTHFDDRSNTLKDIPIFIRIVKPITL